MQIYPDDCADANDLATMLRDAGHQVYTPRTERNLGIPDPSHLAYAATHGFALVTKNPRDFRNLHAEWQRLGRRHAGILLVYMDNILGKDMEPADIVTALQNLLATGLPIDNELHVLNHWR